MLSVLNETPREVPIMLRAAPSLLRCDGVRMVLPRLTLSDTTPPRGLETGLRPGDERGREAEETREGGRGGGSTFARQLPGEEGTGVSFSESDSEVNERSELSLSRSSMSAPSTWTGVATGVEGRVGGVDATEVSSSGLRWAGLDLRPRPALLACAEATDVSERLPPDAFLVDAPVPITATLNIEY